ncbi:hypothetical protein [Enterovibrio norvegicus]|uniref:hypothetical protein n=1 Tax=Enterovibrio norvegicus TaxID=188144 RepID=UPI001E6365C7|nr:hypothetical protein [Enterovibrio norvegicus]MCC4801066.1 hypothetical protein [Enterovibrio norvegicus]
MSEHKLPTVKGNSQHSESKTYLTSLRLRLERGMRALSLGEQSQVFSDYCVFHSVDVSRAFDGSMFDVIHLSRLFTCNEELVTELNQCMENLSKNGVLVLSLLVREGSPQKTALDHGYIPAFAELVGLFGGHAWKLIGKTADQENRDNVKRMVFHLRHSKSMVFLLIGNPGSGKSTITKRFFGQIKSVHGDMNYRAMFDGRVACSESLNDVVKKRFDPAKIQHMTSAIFSNGLAQDLVDTWISVAGHSDFLLDSYVPERNRDDVKACFENRGYIPVELNWSMGHELPSLKETEATLNLFCGQAVEEQPQPSSKSSLLGLGRRLLRRVKRLHV